MQQRKSVVYFNLILTTLLFDIVYSSVLTNICPDTPSCNCTLTDNVDLNFICNSTTSLTKLPTLQPNSLQASVIELHVISSTTNTHGPLITLPTNICAYPNIATLDLSSNNMTGLLNTSELACLGLQLIHVDFSYNNINEININFFKANRNLQSIDLSHNHLITMPLIDGETFVNFPSTITYMNFSFNQITEVDFWPLFVKTRKYNFDYFNKSFHFNYLDNTMTIDMSNNIIENYTNTVPISVEQFTDPPDLRYFYLNSNRLERLSDLLLEQYGVCSTTNPISTAYFIVGISNILLTNNSLICDCESYNLNTYINDGLTDFPEIANGTALLTQATCSSPSFTFGQKYIFSNFSLVDNCDSYVLPNISDIFCSIYPNDTSIAMTPPTYWTSTTTVVTITNNGNENVNGNVNVNNRASNSSLSWYIILGVVLGVLVLLAIVILVCYLYREKILPKKYRSKLINNTQSDENNPNNSYEPIIRNSEISSRTDFPLNGIKPHRASISTSTCGFDDQDNGTMQLDNENHPEQETQTNFQILRSKPPSGIPRSTRGAQRKDNNGTHTLSRRERRLSLSTAADIGTNTTNVVKGIPISTKIQSRLSNGTDKSMFELNTTSIPSKRAKVLPQVKSGMYADSTDDNLLNTSAGALVTSQRQRRRSSLWFRRQNQNIISPLPPRPQSMIARKTVFDHDGSFDEDIPHIPTIESLTNKPSKPLRTLPVLNISVVPAWADDSSDI